MAGKEDIVTVAYESTARERAARKKHKLKWHRNASGGLNAKGSRGEYCVVRQRPDRRHGIHRWGVSVKDATGAHHHSIGSDDSLAAAKGLAHHHDHVQMCMEAREASEAVVVPAGLEETRRKTKSGWKVPAGLPIDLSTYAPKGAPRGAPVSIPTPIDVSKNEFYVTTTPPADAWKLTKFGQIAIQDDMAWIFGRPLATVRGYIQQLGLDAKIYRMAPDNVHLERVPDDAVREDAAEERGGSYRSQVVRALRLMGQSDPEDFVDAHHTDVERYELAGVEPNVAAAILSTSGMHRDVAEPAVAEEGRAPTLEWIEMGDSQFPEWQATHGIYTYDIRKERRGGYRLGVAAGGGAYHFIGDSHATLAAAKKAARDYVQGERGAREAPTRGEWEVVVAHPPHEARGRILSMAGPGYGYAAGDKIILDGFYDDEEARHVANSISRKYRGTVVTFGPKRKMEAAEEADEGPPAGAEERRRPGAHRIQPVETEKECEHGCPTGECKPFSKVTRDPHLFRACMDRAAEIGSLKDPLNVYRLVAADIVTYDEEHLMVVCIDFRGQLRDWFVIALGQRHRVAADVEDIIASVILSKCDGFVMLHNHPSGDPTPSRADGSLTNMVRKAAAVACPNIPLVDHLVIGLDKMYSFTAKKIITVKR